MSHIDPTQPVVLQPVHIPKPWGQEIWYTGMESRGVSQVLIGEQRLGLDRYLQSNPAALCDNQEVLLLKILDPVSTPVLGDLYFEVHETKQEVYVVTRVDPDAWASQSGAIRFGMNQQRRKLYADDGEFREAFLKAVQAYEVVRRRLDANTPEPDDANLEQRLRKTMNDFTALQSLNVGDVVKVPTWTPHALQHGVRVVEFQTATYERYIISFAQQVVTQDHWDSPHAIARMRLEPPAPPVFEQVQQGIERIVKFDDFNVWRCRQVSKPLQLPQHIPYAVCMCIEGQVQVGDLTLGSEEACFVPKAAIDQHLLIQGTEAQTLIAAPAL